MSELVSPLIRAALFVSSLERATTFYEMLGLTEIYYEGALDPASANAVLARPHTGATRCRILKTPAGADTGPAPNFGMVGLFQLDDPAPEPIARSDDHIRQGEVALVFYIGDRLDAVLAQAEAAGARRLTDPVLFEMPHATQREILMRDPDGVLINLIERPPSRAWQTEPPI